MTPRIPWLADLRAERFLHKRMGADAHAAFRARGWVDVPIPDGTYRTVMGHHTFARAALRITAAAKVFVVSQDDGHAIGTCCVYAVGGIDELLLHDRPRLPGLPVADQIYALWWLACHAPHHLLAQSNYIPMRVPEYLTSSHPGDICRKRNCPEAVKQNPATGRYFITMGHAGFNSPANNVQGYATPRMARAAIMFYRRGELFYAVSEGGR